LSFGNQGNARVVSRKDNISPRGCFNIMQQNKMNSSNATKDQGIKYVEQDTCAIINNHRKEGCEAWGIVNKN
jgi:hypothetical protein